MPTEDSFTCPRCGKTSYHPQDILEGYCGNCHDWTANPVRSTRFGRDTHTHVKQRASDHPRRSDTRSRPHDTAITDDNSPEPQHQTEEY